MAIEKVLNGMNIKRSSCSMIYESHVWKKELKKERSKFTRQVINNPANKANNDKDDEINLTIEKFFFITAFIIRKLNEARKISDELINTWEIPVERYQRINSDREINYWNNLRLEEFYDLDHLQNSKLGIATLCNYIIHSFIFHPLYDYEEKEKFLGIVFNSDRSKDKVLYILKVEDYLLLIGEVIKDDIVTIKTFADGKEIRSRILDPL